MEVVLFTHENVRGAELVIVGGTCLRIDARKVVRPSAGQRHRPLPHRQGLTIVGWACAFGQPMTTSLSAS